VLCRVYLILDVLFKKDLDGAMDVWDLFQNRIYLALVYVPVAANINEFLSTALPLLLKPPAFLLLTSW